MHSLGAKAATVTRKALLEVDTPMMYYDECICVEMKVYGRYIQLLVHHQGLLFGKIQRMKATSTSAFQLKPSLYAGYLSYKIKKIYLQLVWS